MKSHIPVAALAAAVSITAALAPSPAGASIVLEDYTFSSTAVSGSSGSGPVSGSFTLAHDLSADSYILDALHLSFAGIFFGRTDSFLDDSSGSLTISGADFTGGDGSGDYDLTFNPSPLTFVIFHTNFSEFGSTGGNSNSTTGGTISRTIEGGVPEPASWALMLVGFGALGGALRRRAWRRTEPSPRMKTG